VGIFEYLMELFGTENFPRPILQFEGKTERPPRKVLRPWTLERRVRETLETWAINLGLKQLGPFWP